MFSSRSSLAVVLVAGLALCAWAVDPPQPAPSKEQIARWIKQLGSDDFEARQEATQKLWEAGKAAEDAVTAASKHDDLEISRRASELLDKFKWGITPGTPAALVEVIRGYHGVAKEGRTEALAPFLNHGIPGSLALKKILRDEQDPEVRKNMVHALLGTHLPPVMADLLKEQKHVVIENVLDGALDVEFDAAINHYVAYWLLRGRIDERIAYHTKLEGKENKRQARILAHLYRAKGDASAALSAARRSGNERLVDGLLFETAAWKELALRGNALHMSPPNLLQDHVLPPDLNPNDYEDGRNKKADQLAHRASFHRLAGNTVEARKAFDEIRKYQKTVSPTDENEDDIVSMACLINDMPDDAVAALKTRGAWILAYELLAQRFRFAEADALVAQARAKKYPRLDHLEVMQARTWYLLGNKDKALAVFIRHAENLRKEVVAAPGKSRISRLGLGLNDLIEEEWRAGLTDLAFEHAGAIRDVGQDSSNGNPDVEWLLFPEQSVTAWNLEILLSRMNKGRAHSAVLNRIRQLLDGKVPQKEVIALLDAAAPIIEKIKTQIDEGDPLYALHSEIWKALADVAVRAGLDERAKTCREKAQTCHEKAVLVGFTLFFELVDEGDLHADRKQWEAAARFYERAWKMQPTYPLSLYLHGHALVQAGHAKEGQEAMEHAHWVSLGDVASRDLFAQLLSERGWIRDSQRENDIIRHIGDSADPLRAEATGRAALSRKDYRAYAAALQQQSVLQWPVVTHVTPLWTQMGRLERSASIHHYSALDLIRSGKVAEAVKEAELALAILPSNLDPALDLIAELEALGRKDEATGLYRRSRAVYEQMCKDHPGFAIGHNALALLSAGCCRDLDDALVHARKAIDLAPEVATNHETLAEVYFQMGRKDRAIQELKKAESLHADSVSIQKQLKRLEAGDPKAPRPKEEKAVDWQ